MKKKERAKKEKRSNIFTEFLSELSGNIIFEIIWNMIMFIPRMLIRLIAHIW